MPDSEWHKYEKMRDEGASEHAVYLQAREDGLPYLFDSIRMLREVFDVDLGRAKEITLQADGVANSLAEHQQSLLPAIEEAVRQFDDDPNCDS